MGVCFVSTPNSMAGA